MNQVVCNFGRSLILLSCLGVAACTEPGETTGMGAAAGGVLGAGLGAIVGSATGDVGTGLVLGAVAGSAAGAAVGNVVEGQQQTILTQDEAIERHERIIAAQRAELNEIRKLNNDSIPSVSREDLRASLKQLPNRRYSDIPVVQAPKTETSRVNRVVQRDLTSTNTAQRIASFDQKSRELSESTIIASNDTSALKKDFENAGRAAGRNISAEQLVNSENQISKRSVSEAIDSNSLAAINIETENGANSAECVQAAGEVKKAQSSQELADRLFHYRRALRLCPEEPSYHNSLGEVYSALNRRADAEFEFKEALKINPEFAPAQDNLNSLR